MKKKELLFGGDADWSHSDLGSAIHTALRKACDSTVTTIAYNLVGGLDAPWRYLLKRWACVLRGTPDDAWNNYTRKHQCPEGIWITVVDDVVLDLSTPNGAALALRGWCEDWSSCLSPDAGEREKLDREHGDGFTSLVYALCGVFAEIPADEWEHGLLAYVFYAKT